MFYLVLICIVWAVSAIATFIMMLLTRAFCWLLALISMPQKDLPFFLAWFGQYDDNLDGDKDPGWRDPANGNLLLPDEGWRKWRNRTKWIFRNPSQYFDYWKAGQVIKQIEKLSIYGNSAVSDSPFMAGWCLKLLFTEDRTLPFFRWVWKWPWWNKCIDVKLGYAIWDSVKQGDRVKLVFTFDPMSKTS